MTNIQLASGKAENYHAGMSDDTTPATKADIVRLEGRTQKLEGSVQRLEQRFERLYEADDQILAILGSIDKRLTPKVEDHEKRIVRLEESVA